MNVKNNTPTLDPSRISSAHLDKLKEIRKEESKEAKEEQDDFTKKVKEYFESIKPNKLWSILD